MDPLFPMLQDPACPMPIKLLGLLAICLLALWGHRKINSPRVNEALFLIMAATLIGMVVTLIPPH